MLSIKNTAKDCDTVNCNLKWVWTVQCVCIAVDMDIHSGFRDGTNLPFPRKNGNRMASDYGWALDLNCSYIRPGSRIFTPC